ncbi:MAG: hypothetical protein ACYDEJ_05475 [Desulfitobacteriaceae bacterium]
MDTNVEAANCQRMTLRLRMAFAQAANPKGTLHGEEWNLPPQKSTELPLPLIEVGVLEVDKNYE